MAKSPYGPNGPFIGKFGASVGYMLNGQSIIRALPRPGNKALTLPRKNTCGKIKVLSNFLRYMPAFLKITFLPASLGTVKNWYNLAVQHNNPQAIKGYYPNLEIDYPNVVLSIGNLNQPVNAIVKQYDEGLRFSWDVTEAQKDSNEQAMLIVYFPLDHTAFYELGGAKRSAGFDVLSIPSAKKAWRMEVFICFSSVDRQDFSNSLYLGSLNAFA